MAKLSQICASILHCKHETKFTGFIWLTNMSGFIWLTNMSVEHKIMDIVMPLTKGISRRTDRVCARGHG